MEVCATIGNRRAGPLPPGPQVTNPAPRTLALP